MVRSAFLTILLAAAVSGRAQSNLVANGNFESYGKPTASWTAPGVGDYGVPPGSTNITGWMVVTGSVAYLRGWPAADGVSSIDLSGDGSPVSGGLTQTVPTRSGTPYVFSFQMSGNPGATFPPEPSAKRMLVRVGDYQQVYSYDTAVEQNTFADMKWRQNEVLYIATSSLTQLAFVNVMGTNFTGPALDNVVLRECIPPTLSIARASGNVVVSWNDTVCPVVLESCATVGAGAVWQTNTIPLVHVGERSFVTNGMSGSRYFRLRLQ